MKADACRLEITAKISKEEAENLPRSRIEGTLRFVDPESREKRDMLFSIGYDPNQSPHVFEEHVPSGYFGNAAEVNVTINKYVYDCLKERGSGGGRFPHGSTGKIIIKVDDR